MQWQQFQQCPHILENRPLEGGKINPQSKLTAPLSPFDPPPLTFFSFGKLLEFSSLQNQLS